jgi:hypothetical protein
MAKEHIMDDLKLIFHAKRTYIISIILFVSILNLIAIYIYNFHAEKEWLDNFRNLFLVFNLMIILYVPYRLTGVILAQKHRIHGITLGLLGLKINLIILILFGLYSTLDFIIKLIINGQGILFSHVNTIVATTFIGAVMILIIGFISSLISSYVKRGN